MNSPIIQRGLAGLIGSAAMRMRDARADQRPRKNWHGSFYRFGNTQQLFDGNYFLSSFDFVKIFWI